MLVKTLLSCSCVSLGSPFSQLFSLGVLVDLWGQVVLESSKRLNLILNDKGGLRGEHQLDIVAQSRSLIEHIEVSERERQAHFVELAFSAGCTSSTRVVVSLDFDGSRADLAINRKLDILQAGFNRDSLAELV